MACWMPKLHCSYYGVWKVPAWLLNEVCGKVCRQAGSSSCHDAPLAKPLVISRRKTAAGAWVEGSAQPTDEPHA